MGLDIESRGIWTWGQKGVGAPRADASASIILRTFDKEVGRHAKVAFVSGSVKAVCHISLLVKDKHNNKLTTDKATDFMGATI